MAPRGTKASPTSLKLRRALSAAAAGASRAARRMAARDRARPSSIGPTLTYTSHTRVRRRSNAVGWYMRGARVAYVPPWPRVACSPAPAPPASGAHAGRAAGSGRGWRAIRRPGRRQAPAARRPRRGARRRRAARRSRPRGRRRSPWPELDAASCARPL